LTALDISYNPLGSAGARALSAVLKADQSSLRRLHAVGCQLSSDDLKEVAEALTHKKQMRVLRFVSRIHFTIHQKCNSSRM
jgi:Ran GTPase-activating protein (RanGAP) involved in mRNA processing and transport